MNQLDHARQTQQQSEVPTSFWGLEQSLHVTPVGLLKWLGERRDGFLVSGAILYGLGYLVWCLNIDSFGGLPALDFQYVMAGIVPALILVIAWLVVANLSRLRVRLMRIKVLRWILPIAIIIFATLHWYLIKHLTIDRALWSLVLLALVILLLTLGEEQEERWSGWMSIALFSVSSLAAYGGLYQHLPRQLGGPKPRCAYVDLVPKELSSNALIDLVKLRPSRTSSYEDEAAALKSKGEVVRSKRLDVYFSNTDYLLVREANETPDQDFPLINAHSLYELRKQTFRDVWWCDGSPLK